MLDIVAGKGGILRILDEEIKLGTRGSSEGFFTKMFQLLSGTNKLQQQIEAGKTEEEIKASWKDGLTKYSIIRKKYLLYN